MAELEEMGSSITNQANANSKNESKFMSELGRSILLLATLVATATYAAGFNTPGGVWQDTAGHLPGDPIIRSTQYVRYLVFFYCNATAFASSLMVFVLLLLLQVRRQKNPRIIVIPLVLVMVLGLLSLIGAYAAGTFRGTFTAVYTSLLVAAVFTYVAVQWVLAHAPDRPVSDLLQFESHGERLREMLMQLATFTLTVTYVSGQSTPGGFWDSTEDGHRPGDPILKGGRLTGFFLCNTTAFMASLLILAVLLTRRIRQTVVVLCGSMILVFLLLASYSAGSRVENRFVYAGLAFGIIILCAAQSIVFTIVIQVVRERASNNNFWAKLQDLFRQEHREEEKKEEEKYSSYIQYLAALAFTVTYQAGMDPPGGLWQENGDGHMAGDPILRTTNPRRYRAFFYCNSVAFVASLVCIILVQIRPLLKHRALEQAMILDLLSLVGAYAMGSCRDETTTVYAMGIGGAALVYVTLHVVLLDETYIHDRRKHEDDRSFNRMGYALFLFALLVATITYQTGLTPPGGFLLKDDESGHHAGDPFLLYNHPRRYKVFFYCNSTSFMVSIAIIILLVNHNIYTPALRTHALSICTAVSFFCLLAAFAAGTTQHLKTSIYTLVLLAVVLLFALLLLLVFFLRPIIFPTPSPIDEQNITLEEYDQTRVNRKKEQANRIYLMTVGILVASVTYQAGLHPPGGSWQHSSDGHYAGYPVMQGNRRQRYRVFFYANTISFSTSTMVMVSLLWLARSPLMEYKLLSRIMYSLTITDVLGLLVAYTAGSGREWQTSVNVAAIVFSVLTYFSIHVAVSLLRHKHGGQEETHIDSAQAQSQECQTPRGHSFEPMM